MLKRLAVVAGLMAYGALLAVHKFTTVAFFVLASLPFWYVILLMDTANQFQWFPWWGSYTRRLWWKFSTTARTVDKHVFVTNVYLTGTEEDEDLYFHGVGVSFRVGRKSATFGVGRVLQPSEDGLSVEGIVRPLDVPMDKLRNDEDVWFKV